MSGELLKKLNDIVNKIYERVNRNKRIVIDFLESSQKELYMLYTDYRNSSLTSLYYTLKSFSSEKKVSIDDLESYSLYIAPYNEGREPDILILSSRDGSNTLLRTISSLALTGHRGLIISSWNLDENENLKRYTRELFRVVYVDDNEFSLETNILLISSALEILRKSLSSPRINRLYNEITSLNLVIKDLYERYHRELAVLRDVFLKPSTRLSIITTPSARIFEEEIIRISLSRNTNIDLFSIKYYSPRLVREDSYLAILFTEAEQAMISDLKREYLFKRDRLIEIMLKTDPVISSVYFGILAKIFELSLEQVYDSS